MKPEQSVPPVRLDPPYTYGLPTNCNAKLATSDPLPPAAGAYEAARAAAFAAAFFCLAAAA